MPIPSRMAARGPGIATTDPSSAIVPASGWTNPNRQFISVDLPAPFSPTSACTSPRRIWRSTASSASSDPNRLVIPCISTAGAGPAAATWSFIDGVGGRRRSFELAVGDDLAADDAGLDLLELSHDVLRD